MNIERVTQVIADLDNYAVFADHTGNKQLGRAMRQAAVLLREMAVEYEAANKSTATMTIVSTTDFDKWQENPTP
jgi:predicted hydrolase (HD superfamily)